MPRVKIPYRDSIVPRYVRCLIKITTEEEHKFQALPLDVVWYAFEAIRDLCAEHGIAKHQTSYGTSDVRLSCAHVMARVMDIMRERDMREADPSQWMSTSSYPMLASWLTGRPPRELAQCAEASVRAADELFCRTAATHLRHITDAEITAEIDLLDEYGPPVKQAEAMARRFSKMFGDIVEYARRGVPIDVSKCHSATLRAVFRGMKLN